MIRPVDSIPSKAKQKTIKEQIIEDLSDAIDKKIYNFELVDDNKFNYGYLPTYAKDTVYYFMKGKIKEIKIGILDKAVSYSSYDTEIAHKGSKAIKVSRYKENDKDRIHTYVHIDIDKYNEILNEVKEHYLLLKKEAKETED